MIFWDKKAVTTFKMTTEAQNCRDLTFAVYKDTVDTIIDFCKEKAREGQISCIWSLDHAIVDFEQDFRIINYLLKKNGFQSQIKENNIHENYGFRISWEDEKED